MVKNIIKKILNSIGYNIHKVLPAEDPSEEIELKYENKWLQNYNINTILDIGANEGQFAKKISYLFPSAKFHCFEPLPDTFIKLKEKLASNANVTFYPFALGSKEEELVINLNEFSPSSSFLDLGEGHKTNFDFAVETTSCNVQVKRLDDIQITLQEPVLIKIDVQGFEDKVIAGGLETLKKAQIVIIEVSFRSLYENQPLFDNIYKLLLELGFAFHGNLEQLESPLTNEILQADAIFVK